MRGLLPFTSFVDAIRDHVQCLTESDANTMSKCLFVYHHSLEPCFERLIPDRYQLLLLCVFKIWSVATTRP